MAEELKPEEKTQEAKKVFGAIFKVVLGLALLALGVASVIRWFESLKIVFTGCIGLFLILAGLITLAIAKE